MLLIIMRSTIIVSTLCGLSIAAPRPQLINVGAIDDLPLPAILGLDVEDFSNPAPTYNPTSAASAAAAAIPTDPVSVEKREAFKKRAACVKEPNGYVLPRFL
jgi:hypothetical protein